MLLTFSDRYLFVIKAELYIVVGFWRFCPQNYWMKGILSIITGMETRPLYVTEAVTLLKKH